MSILLKCPDDIVRRGTILNCNGFGFQEPGGVKNYFVIARLADDISNNNLEQITNISGSKTVENKDFIGRDFLIIHWSEYILIDNVLNALLSIGLKFVTHNKLEVQFDPSKGDSFYSQEIAENKFIERFTNFEKECPDTNIQNIFISTNKHSILHYWNWKTIEGKQFCHRVRQKLGKNDSCQKSEHNYYNWTIFQNYDPNTLKSIESNNIFDNNDIVDDEICIICMDNIADTMVLPCEHTVVCKKCSAKLKMTNDAKTCVKCRREITSILD